MSAVESECKMAFLMTDLAGANSLPGGKLCEVLELMGYTYDPKSMSEYSSLASFDIPKLVEIVNKEFASLNEEAALSEAFKQFDASGAGVLQTGDFRNIMNKMGTKLTEEEVEALVKMADPSGSGSITISAFQKALIDQRNA